MNDSLDADAVLWSHASAERDERPLLVLLHGYGADERDLFGLVPYLPPDFAVAALRAPLAPPFPAPGYSWYPIEGLESRLRVSRPSTLVCLSSVLEAARELVQTPARRNARLSRSISRAITRRCTSWVPS